MRQDSRRPGADPSGGSARSPTARGPLLVLGAAGTGKTEVLARRLARLAAEGTGPERVLVIGSTRATARRLRERAEALLEGPFEELWIGTWETIGERLLREHAEAAGLDPFFDVLGPAERLAMLLDRLDELPLRRHEIRGNPAGLLARLLARIDALKAEAVGPAAGARPRREAAATDEAEREAARRELEFAELYAAHDRILADAGSLDRGDVFLALNCLLADRPDARRQIAERFPHLMVDELEEATAGPARDPRPPSPPTTRTTSTRWSPRRREERDDTGLVPPRSTPAGDVSRSRAAVPQAGAALLALHERARPGAGGGPRGRAPARRRRPPRRRSACWSPTRPARAAPVAAAMEERGIPFHLSGPAALFQRPEVRDAIAWLRVLADPDDSAAAARALTRPPIELRSGDLARLTTIARRRKLDMVAACEAALDSPQIPPEARERIQAFLKLYGAASAAMEERRADVFVRRLIERVGLRRQRLFAAQPEVAERLLGLSRLAELATAWARREPHGSTRGFVRYLSAVAEAGVEPAGGEEPPSPGSVRGSTVDAVKGIGFDHVFVLGLEGERRLGADRLAGAHRARPLPGRARRRRGGAPLPLLRGGAGRRRGGEEEHEEELFGPAEGLHATYRTLREEVLEASWRAGRELSEPRLDTAIDVNRAIARYLELLKLAALAQRPGDEPTAEAIEAVNGLLRQVATPEQQAELDASALDSYLLDSERERGRRPRADRRPRGALAGGLPAAPRRRRAQPLGLRPRPLPDLPAEVQVRAGLRHPAGADDQPALRHPHPQRPRALPQGAAGAGRRRPAAADGPVRGRLAAHRLRLHRRRAAVPRPRPRGDAPLLGARARRRGRAGLAGAQVRLQDRRAPRARPGRPGRPPARRRLRADRLQDRRAQDRGRAGERPAAGALPPRRPRGLGHRGRAPAATTTCSTPTRSRRRPSPTTPSGSSAPCCRSARASSARTSSRAPRRRSAAGATTG